jgi:hypothetical protein
MKQKILDYIPHSLGELRAWLANFKAQLGSLGASLGYTAPQITLIQGYAQGIIDKIDAVVTAQAALDAAITARDTTKKTNLALLRIEAQKIKDNPATPAGAADDLGLNGSHHTVDEDNYQPDLSVSLVGGMPTLKFTKKGVDGMKIMHRLKGAASWSLLAVVTKSPYVDHITLANPGVAETWEYCAYGLINDQPIGLQSDVVHITYAG